MYIKELHIKSVLIGVCICFFLISCDEKKMAEFHISKATNIGWEEKEPCEIKMIYEDDSTFFSGRIKCRGGSSSKFNKHSYGLELDQAHDLCGVANDDDWVLNASYIDKTFMRHKFCYDLYRQMGENNEAPKSDFVQVTYNRKYDGVYLLKEKLTATRLGLDKTDSAARLYKGPYIFKRNLDWSLHDTTIIIHQKFPKWETDKKAEDLIALRAFVLGSTDEEFASKCPIYFDIQNIIDWHLLIMVTNGGDGLIKNNYLYKTDKDTPFRFAIWDCDHSLGKDGDGELNFLKSTPNFENNILLSRLMAVKELNYKKSLKKRYNELRDSGIFSSQNFLRMVNEMESSLAPSIQKNATRWPLDGEWYYDGNSFEQEVEILKEFIELNLKTLDEKFGYD